MTNNIHSEYRRFLIAYLLTALSICLGTIVNAMLAGHLIGADAVSVINLSTPLLQLYYTIHLLIGAGGGILASYALGEANRTEANDVFTRVLLATMSTGIIISVVGGLVFPEAVANLFCSHSDLQVMNYAYMRPVLLGAPLYILVSVLNTMVAVDGEPRRVSVAIVADNAVAIVLSWLLLTHGIGVEGVCYAILIGHAVGVIVLLSHWAGKAETFRLHLRSTKHTMRRILSTGAPLAVASICLTILLYTANTIVLRTMGRNGIFVLSVALNLLMIYNLFINGSCQTLQSLGAMQIGRGDEGKEDLHYVVTATLKFMTVSLGLLCALVCLYPEGVTALFGGQGEPELMEEAGNILPIFALSFLPYCYLYVAMILLKLFHYDGIALFLSFALSLTVVIVMLIMEHWAPAYIWWSYLIAYVLESVVLAVIILYQRIHLRIV